MRLLSVALMICTICLPARAEGLADVEGHYRVDAASIIHFSVAQLGGAAIEGRFTAFSGEFQLGGEDASRSTIAFSLKPGSVSAVDPRVEAFIRSSAVFDVDAHPSVTYRSTRVTRTGDKTAAIDGMLSAKGVTHGTRFLVTFTGRDGAKLKFHVTGKMSRALFHMDVGTPIYSNMVVLDMELVGRRM